MQTQEIIKILDKEFVYDESDVFSVIMPEIDPHYKYYCTERFLKYYQGLMLGGKSAISRIACACFLSNYVVEKAVELEADLLFVKHPLEWEEIPGRFAPLDKLLYEKCIKSGINVYVAHSSLDRHHVFSPSLNLSEILGFKNIKKLKIEDNVFGVIVNTNLSFNNLCLRVKEKIGLNNLQVYHISDRVNKIAITSGGGDSEECLYLATKNNCNTYLTGIAFCEGNEYSRIHNLKFRELAKKLEVNLIGASHYVTERYGIMKVVNYLKILGLDLYFIEEIPKLEELKCKWGCII